MFQCIPISRQKASHILRKYAKAEVSAKEVRERKLTDVLLSTGAKLGYAQGGYFLFGYAADGTDATSVYCNW